MRRETRTVEAANPNFAVPRQRNPAGGQHNEGARSGQPLGAFPESGNCGSDASFCTILTLFLMPLCAGGWSVGVSSPRVLGPPSCAIGSLVCERLPAALSRNHTLFSQF